MSPIRSYLCLLNLSFRRLTLYRLDFCVGVLSSSLQPVLTLVFVWAVFTAMPEVAGWTVGEATLLMAAFGVAWSVKTFWFGNLWSLGSDYVRTGRLDQLLVRPLDPLLQVMAARVDLGAVGGLAASLAIGIAAASRVGIPLGRCLGLLAFLVPGIGVLAGIELALASLSFWMVDSAPVMWFVTGAAQFAQYPLVLFPRAVRVTLTFVLPYAFVAYFPVAWAMNKLPERPWPPGLGLATLAAGLVWTMALVLWRWGLSRYSGTGS
jgi:ABC-2 type transport system permease protein